MAIEETAEDRAILEEFTSITEEITRLQNKLDNGWRLTPIERTRYDQLYKRGRELSPVMARLAVEIGDADEEEVAEDLRSITSD